MSKKYLGMTANERLYLGGLIKEFYAAAEKKDIDAMVEMLKKVELTQPSIDPILNSFGLKRNGDLSSE